jgi:hypothetical protein
MRLRIQGPSLPPSTALPFVLVPPWTQRLLFVCCWWEEQLEGFNYRNKIAN